MKTTAALWRRAARRGRNVETQDDEDEKADGQSLHV